MGISFLSDWQQFAEKYQKQYQKHQPGTSLLVVNVAYKNNRPEESLRIT